MPNVYDRVRLVAYNKYASCIAEWSTQRKCSHDENYFLDAARTRPIVPNFRDIKFSRGDARITFNPAIIARLIKDMIDCVITEEKLYNSLSGSRGFKNPPPRLSSKILNQDLDYKILSA